MIVELTASAPPLVKVVIEAGDVTSGTAATVVGVAEGREWLVRGGAFVGDGSARVLVDAMAPVNTPLTYEVRTASGVVAARSTTRWWSGGDLITSLDGRQAVNFRWQKAGGARLAQVPRFAAYDVPGRERTLLHLGDVAGAGGGSLTARMGTADTRTMRALVRENLPMVLLHNPASCQIPDCDLEPVDVVYFTNVPNDRTPAVHRAERDWDLTYLLVDDPEPDAVVPLSTWEDFDAAGLTWAQFDGLGLTWAEFDRTDWRQYGLGVGAFGTGGFGGSDL